MFERMRFRNAEEHARQAELILREIEQDLPTAQVQQGEVLMIQSQLALVHALSAVVLELDAIRLGER